ncbi:phosphoglycerate mutase (2,3-diphosphoglycerate-independent) [Candidatus Woesearchaeota archaeon B3_Woes]|nr:MAG: phosphoglycerate mutase (2,3-diphosphoglycerate-independent) [Candidatus Woesearchaeota archaeon B3_Woes]
MMNKPVVLIIRDGWGYRKNKKDNYISEANTINTDNLMEKYPTTILKAAGKAVGLPPNYQGNSEVGHVTIGSGRIIKQPLTKINKSIRKGDFFRNKQFINALKNCKKHNSTLHIIGLLQKEGVHAHKKHLYALLDLCKKQNFKNFKIHIITDGRDAPPKNSIKNIRQLLRKTKNIATISGRYYAMDRDKRWDRTKKAYECIANANAEEFEKPIKLLKTCYKNNETDEFIKPRKSKNYKGIKSNDSVIFYNFRTDRLRQLTQLILKKNIFPVTMTKYYKPSRARVAFEEPKTKNTLGEVLSRNKIKQLRISETEKYAHVTFFFNNQIEKPYKNEKRILIHSPKVATYDLKPEMSAYKITSRLLKEMDKYKFIVVNIVNGDMVGHTSVKKACLKAAETVDKCVKKITDKVLEKDGTALVFADHGNLEDKGGKYQTSHTKNKVPLIVVSNKKLKLKNNKGLKDIAPTVLKLLNIKQPKEMTGKSII